MCGDIDGCFVHIYENNPPNYSDVLPLDWGKHIKYWPESGYWTSNAQKGTDSNNTTQHLVNWSAYYLTDGEYAQGNNRGDNSLGISVYNDSSGTNNPERPVFIIRD